MTKNKHILLLSFIVLALSLPFCNRAFFVDDGYHVQMAQALLDNPLRPYDFTRLDDPIPAKGWNPGSVPDMVNPPLMHYYLAFITMAFGSETYKLRLSFLLFPLLSAIGMYYLGRRFSSHPLSAAILLVVTPAFWMNGSSLLLDMCMLTFIIWGIEFFLRGWDTDKLRYLLFGGICLGFAPMVKYSAYPLLALIIVWAFINWSKSSGKKRYMSILIIPLFVTLMWFVWNIGTYGESHFIASFGRASAGRLMPKLMVGLIFLSGISIFSFSYFIIAFEKEKKLFYASLIFVVALVLLFSSPLGGFAIWQSWIMSVFLATSILIFIIILKNIQSLNAFLVVWFMGGFISLLLPIPWVAARYYLAIFPPFILLTINTIEKHFPKRGVFKLMMAMIILCTGAVSLTLVISDYLQADIYRLVADDIEKEVIVKQAEHRKIVIGAESYGYSYYLREKGWKSLSHKALAEKGDIVITTTHALPSVYTFAWKRRLKVLKSKEYTTFLPVRVMDLDSSAGFYGSIGGILPFSFSRKPLEVFTIYRIE